jgi:hypothetical protein
MRVCRAAPLAFHLFGSFIQLNSYSQGWRICGAEVQGAILQSVSHRAFEKRAVQLPYLCKHGPDISPR